MLKINNLDPFKEELILINNSLNFISSKTFFWKSLENYNFLQTFLFMKSINRKHNFKELKSLQRLYLYSNQLTTVPNFNLPNLHTLSLYNNKLTTVPDFNLPNLQIFDLSYNQLTT